MEYKCLSIAGFDGSGGAGIQADLKTFSALGCYGLTVLTALPIQNTCGVKSCYEIPLSAIEEQLVAIFEDIMPDSIKIGMVFSAPVIELVATFLAKYANSIPIVFDPVMLAKDGGLLLQNDAIHALREKLIPMATLITPNLPEANKLVGEAPNFHDLGEKLLELGSKAVLLKGGHCNGETAKDLLLDQQGQCEWFETERISSKNTHGTGCTLSAAICAFLSKGYSLSDACRCAKDYLFAAITAAKDNSVGKGRGPVHHFHQFW